MSDETPTTPEIETPQPATTETAEFVPPAKPPVYKCPICKHVDQVVRTNSIAFDGRPIVQCMKCNTRFAKPAPEQAEAAK